MVENPDRRPLKTRQQRWAHGLAHHIVACGMTPNQMSVGGIIMALCGVGAFWYAATLPPDQAALPMFLAAVCIQLRLLANMLDGLMAVEAGKKTATGALYNELPDRLADILFLVAAGYTANWLTVGWIAALAAVLTAYVRALGGALGFAQDFSGPMAKPHRMFTLTLGCLLATVLPYQTVLSMTLAVIIVGSIITIARRTRHIAHQLAATDA